MVLREAVHLLRKVLPPHEFHLTQLPNGAYLIEQSLVSSLHWCDFFGFSNECFRRTEEMVMTMAVLTKVEIFLPYFYHF